MTDPHPPEPTHGWTMCPAPCDGLPGEEWTCPECGRAFVAVYMPPDDLFIEWVLADGSE